MMQKKISKSTYARKFDKSSVYWIEDPERNRYFLQCQQNYFNHLLNVRGNVFLNEIYDALGIPRSVSGCICGWLRNEENETFIEFQIFDDGYIDFNIDGVIYDKLDN
jgi:hypothetical protein